MKNRISIFYNPLSNKFNIIADGEFSALIGYWFYIGEL